MTKEWWARNAGGIFLTTMVAVALYAASAYITSRVSTEMKGYVPASMWNQWAQERGEWRGEVNQRLKTLENESKILKEQIQASLAAIDKKQDVQNAVQTSALATQTAVIAELRDTLKVHMREVSSP